MALTTRYAEVEPSRGEISAIEGALVVEFGAPWCGHCLAAQALLESAFSAYPGTRHLKVEDGPGRNLGRSFAVRLWPTLIFLRHGQEVARLVRPSDAGMIEQALAALDLVSVNPDGHDAVQVGRADNPTNGAGP